MRKKPALGFFREQWPGTCQCLWPAARQVVNLRDAQLGGGDIGVILVGSNELSIGLGCLITAIEQEHVFRPDETRITCKLVVCEFGDKPVSGLQADVEVLKFVLAGGVLGNGFGHLPEFPASLDTCQGCRGGFPVRFLFAHQGVGEVKIQVIDNGQLGEFLALDGFAENLCRAVKIIPVRKYPCPPEVGLGGNQVLAGCQLRKLPVRLVVFLALQEAAGDVEFCLVDMRGWLAFCIGFGLLEVGLQVDFA